MNIYYTWSAEREDNKALYADASACYIPKVERIEAFEHRGKIKIVCVVISQRAEETKGRIVSYLMSINQYHPIDQDDDEIED